MSDYESPRAAMSPSRISARLRKATRLRLLAGNFQWKLSGRRSVAGAVRRLFISIQRSLPAAFMFREKNLPMTQWTECVGSRSANKDEPGSFQAHDFLSPPPPPPRIGRPNHFPTGHRRQTPPPNDPPARIGSAATVAQDGSTTLASAGEKLGGARLAAAAAAGLS